MGLKSQNLCFLSWVFFGLSIPFAAPGAKGSGTQMGTNPSINNAKALDTNAIHELYLEGDFDKATEILEMALNKKLLRHHQDSVFAFKHLGVMNAAKENAREKGKYYMVQLLNLEPTAKILDMYASDMIYMIFKNIKDEFEESQKRLQRATAHVQENQNRTSTNPSPKSNATQLEPEAKPRKNSHLYWIGGTSLAAIGIGITAYLLTKPEPARSTIYAVE